MKYFCALFIGIFTIPCLGVELSTYATLTNKLSLCMTKRSWKCLTNGNQRIKKITIPVKIDEHLSDEITTVLKISCPNKWKDVLSAHRNAQDTNTIRLRDCFNKAVLQTPTVDRFYRFIKNKIGETVVLNVQHEKLTYTTMSTDTGNEKRIIRAFLWIEIYSSMDVQN